MIVSLQSYLHRWQPLLRKLRTDPNLRQILRAAGSLGAGFCLSAASLGNYAQPLVPAAVCAVGGWMGALLALGGGVGYLVFWGAAGQQCAIWAAACALLLPLCDTPVTRRVPLLLPALTCLLVAGTGLAFQILAGTSVPISIYLLRTVLAGAATRLFCLARSRRDPVCLWLCCGLWVLALAQLAPLPWLGLGFVAAGALGVAGALPAAALSGLALDLGRVTSVPMTAVLCLTYFIRLIPGIKRQIVHLAPGVVYLAVMALCGKWELFPVPALILGGLCGFFLPGSSSAVRRRGETGVAQVRLEMASGVLSQTGQLLSEVTSPPVDMQALVATGAERACGSCPCRKACKDRQAVATLPGTLLQEPLTDTGQLPVKCRKPGRVLQELQRTRQIYRNLLADRHAMEEYRLAVIQQYRFLTEYLQELADGLGSRASRKVIRYRPEIAFCANRREEDNGDRCLSFAGVGGVYYVAICDGMGTGFGAMEEGANAGNLLKKLLCAGYPAEHALRSLNSLCALQGKAGAFTVDLAQLHLESGKVFLYKWGAGASYLLNSCACEKIGTAGPPPGLSVTEGRETVERLSLRRGQTMVLLSEGVGGEDALRCCFSSWDEPLGELAARILELGDRKEQDDATVAAIRLRPERPVLS